MRTPRERRQRIAYRAPSPVLTPEASERIWQGIRDRLDFGERERRTRIAERIGTVCGFVVLALVAFLVGAEAGVWQ